MLTISHYVGYAAPTLAAVGIDGIITPAMHSATRNHLHTQTMQCTVLASNTYSICAPTSTGTMAKWTRWPKCCRSAQPTRTTYARVSCSCCVASTSAIRLTSCTSDGHDGPLCLYFDSDMWIMPVILLYGFSLVIHTVQTNSTRWFAASRWTRALSTSSMSCM